LLHVPAWPLRRFHRKVIGYEQQGFELRTANHDDSDRTGFEIQVGLK